MRVAERTGSILRERIDGDSAATVSDQGCALGARHEDRENRNRAGQRGRRAPDPLRCLSGMGPDLRCEDHDQGIDCR